MRTEEYVAVWVLVNQFAVAHVTPNYTQMVEVPSKDLKMAEIAARAFAEKNQIYYKEELIFSGRPVMTTLEMDSKWYPAALFPTSVKVYTSLQGENLRDFNKETVEVMARLMANLYHTDFIPNAGSISLKD